MASSDIESEKLDIHRVIVSKANKTYLNKHTQLTRTKTAQNLKTFSPPHNQRCTYTTPYTGVDMLKTLDVHVHTLSPLHTKSTPHYYTPNSSRPESLNKPNTKELKILMNKIKNSDDTSNVKSHHITHSTEDGIKSPPGQLTSILDNYFRGAPLWKMMAPFSLCFKSPNMEDMFAEFLQEQTAKNLWWSLLVLSFGVLIEFSLTATTTHNFHPLTQPPHFLYTLGSFTISLTGIIISIFSCYKFFEPYLEMFIAIFGTIFSALLVFTSDHYRVARILGYDEVQAWGRISFSDGPLLLGLSAILWAIALFLPVRSVSLWPVCLSVSLSYQLATFVCGGPDGLRPSILNIVLLMVLSYLALVGRRVLEAQFRLQFMEVYRTALQIQSLEDQISEYQQTTPTTTLELLFNNLKDACVKTEYVMSSLENESPEMATMLSASIKNLNSSIAQLSQIDTLLSVNLNAIIGKPGESIDNQVNEFIRSNFSRQLVNPMQSPQLEDTRKIDFSVDTHNKNTGINLELILTQTHISQNLLTNLDGLARIWDFNVANLENQTDGHALSTIGGYLLEIYTQSILNCNSNVVANFFKTIESKYNYNQYHNSLHGADVCHSTLFLTRCLHIFDNLDEIQQIGLIVASLCHDVAHPGRNNCFLISTGNSLAITYNDQSVLEQFHSAQTFSVLKSHGCNFTSNLTTKQFNYFRSIVIDLILETDTSRHFESISKFKVRRQNPAFDIRQVKEDRWSTVKMAIKAADIGHSAKPWKTHLFWSIRCLEEYYTQGDEECVLGLPFSPLCNRQQAVDIPKSQVGFIQWVCLEVFQELYTVEQQSKITQNEQDTHKSNRSNFNINNNPMNINSSTHYSVSSRPQTSNTSLNACVNSQTKHPKLEGKHTLPQTISKVFKTVPNTHCTLQQISTDDLTLKRKSNFSSSSPPIIQNNLKGKQRFVTFASKEMDEKNNKNECVYNHFESIPYTHTPSLSKHFQSESFHQDSYIKENCLCNLNDNKKTWESFAEAFENLTEQESSAENILQMFKRLINN